MPRHRYLMVILTRRKVQHDFAWLPTRGLMSMKDGRRMKALLWGNWIVSWGEVYEADDAADAADA